METPKQNERPQTSGEDEFEQREYSSPPCYLHEFAPPEEAKKKSARSEPEAGQARETERTCEPQPPRAKE